MAQSNEPSILDFLKSLFSRGERLSLAPTKKKPKRSKTGPKTAKKTKRARAAERLSLAGLSWPMLALAAFALLLCLLFIPRLNRGESYIIPIIAWLSALAAYPLALGYRPADLLPAVSGFIERNRPVVLPLSLLTLASLLLRVWDLSGIPFALSGDEAAMGLEATRVLSGEITNPFETGWTSVPTMTFYMLALPIRFLGSNIFALRIMPALVGAFSIPIIFFLVRRLANSRLAWLVAGLVAVYHYHIHFSRLGSPMVMDPFFAALSLLFLHRALSAKAKTLDWALLGFSTGLALYFYAGARFVFVLVAVLLAYHAVLNPRDFLRRHSAGILIALGAFIISAGPMLQLAIRFPEVFNARVNQIGILQNGWLANEMTLTGQSAAQLLWEQFRRSALAFNFFPDRTVWYGLKTPLLDPFFGALMVLGLGFASLRLLLPRADRGLAYMVAWFWGPVLSGGMLTVDPPSSMRLITLAVPACFFIALALQKSAAILRDSLPQLQPIYIYGLAGLVFALISLNTYFRVFSPLHIAGGPRAEFATLTAPRLADFIEEYDVVFLGQPFMSWQFDTFPYLLPEAQVIDMPADLNLALVDQPLQQGRGVVFVLLPERLEELTRIQERFPNGRLEEIGTESEWKTVSTLYFVGAE